MYVIYRGLGVWTVKKRAKRQALSGCADCPIDFGTTRIIYRVIGIR